MTYKNFENTNQRDPIKFYNYCCCEIIIIIIELGKCIVIYVHVLYIVLSMMNDIIVMEIIGNI